MKHSQTLETVVRPRSSSHSSSSCSILLPERICELEEMDRKHICVKNMSDQYPCHSEVVTLDEKQLGPFYTKDSQCRLRRNHD